MSQVAVIGAGWAGLAAAVHAVSAGHEVHVFEMAQRAGGRARSDDTAHGRLDNGQHILIGAYRDTLNLMQQVGVDSAQVLRRSPLELRFPDGSGFALQSGRADWAFARAVLSARQWGWRDRWLFLRQALSWRRAGFRCDRASTVADLCRELPKLLVRDLIEPLCVAALNTPMQWACGQTFLTVLRDALFGGPGSADLLLPIAPLAELLPEPALAWLRARGARLHLGHRVMQLARRGAQWRIGELDFDSVILCVTAREAARLVEPINPIWSQQAATLSYQPIVTVWLHDDQLRWRSAMLMFRSGPQAPAQFGFSLAALGGPDGRFTWVVSAAQAWLDQGLEATALAVLAQARASFPGYFGAADTLVHAGVERRATLACLPGLDRPPADVAAGLLGAGDFVAGPYPSTLEGAVRSGRQAAARVNFRN